MTHWLCAGTPQRARSRFADVKDDHQMTVPQPDSAVPRRHVLRILTGVVITLALVAGGWAVTARSGSARSGSGLKVSSATAASGTSAADAAPVVPDAAVTDLISADDVCPGKQSRTLPAPTRPGAARQLVPGRPSRALLCRYAGLDAAPRGRFSSRATLTGSKAAQLAGWLNQGRPVPRVMHCPNDTGGEELITFTYSTGPALRVLVDLSGCEIAFNGRLGLFTFPAAFTELTALNSALK
jgi:hypothetical protein